MDLIKGSEPARKKTLAKDILLSGVGIHSGMDVNLHLKPSSSGRVVFSRTDQAGHEFQVDPEHVEAENNSTLVSEGYRVRTIEHLMASLYIFGVDSILVELDGEEVPILDGSALPFIHAILQVGVKDLPQKREFIEIIKSFTLRDKDAYISVSANPDFSVIYSIDFAHPLILKQELSLSVNPENFKEEIAPARTFGFLKDVPALRERGLALGGSFSNAVVLDDEKVISGPLRFPDEFVRHKILDLIGDLSLLGHPVLGSFKVHKGSHPLHHKLVQFLLRNTDCWKFRAP